MTALFVLRTAREDCFRDNSSPGSFFLHTSGEEWRPKGLMALAWAPFGLLCSWSFCPSNPGCWALLLLWVQEEAEWCALGTWEPAPSAMSGIAFVSRRFWGTQMGALPFFKVIQKASLSRELWRAQILLFGKFVLIFYILTLMKDPEPWLPARGLHCKGSLHGAGLASSSSDLEWKWTHILRSPVTTFTFLPFPQPVGAVRWTGSWRAGGRGALSRVRENTEQQKRRSLVSWLRMNITGPLQLQGSFSETDWILTLHRRTRE